MGYVAQKTLYRLKFADPAYAGLEVTTSVGSMDTFVRVAKLAGIKRPRDHEPSADARSLGAMDMLDDAYTAFSSVLVSWNLETEDGVPVPATKEGLYSQELLFIKAILKAWTDVVGSIDAPLSQTSSAGNHALEESLPMETRSPSLLS